jgi:hypothetical protein
VAGRARGARTVKVDEIEFLINGEPFYFKGFGKHEDVVVLEALPVQRTMLLGMIVADINNPVFHGMIRGAERTAMHAGYIMLVIETQESVHTEKQAPSPAAVSGRRVILSSSRMPDASIRDAAKHRPLVLLNRTSPGSAAVNRPLKRSWHQEAELAEPVLLPTRLVVRDPTGRKRNR